MLTLIGVQRKAGTYEGNAYDNFILHCLEDSPQTPTICGEVCEKIKLKANKVRDAFDGLISNDNDWRGLIGSCIRVSYDKFGNAEHITVVEMQGEGVRK